MKMMLVIVSYTLLCEGACGTFGKLVQASWGTPVKHKKDPWYNLR